MNETVMIKSYQNGITLVLDAGAEFSVILDEIAVKFSESCAFFQDAHVALSLEGRSLTREEEIEILSAIQKNSQVRVICLIGRDEEKEKFYIRALRQVEKHLAEEEKKTQNTEGEKNCRERFILRDFYQRIAVRFPLFRNRQDDHYIDRA